MVEQSALGDSGLRCHGVERRTSRSALIEQSVERVEQLLFGLRRIACHGLEPSRWACVRRDVSARQLPPEASLIPPETSLSIAVPADVPLSTCIVWTVQCSS